MRVLCAVCRHDQNDHNHFGCSLCRCRWATTFEQRVNAAITATGEAWLRNAALDPDGEEPRTPVPRRLLVAARERIRHDHGYPIEVYSAEHPHHCPGCDVEEDLDSALRAHTERPT